MTKRWGRSADHPDLIGPVRELLKQTGKPYVIENVEGSPLINPIMLCGSMFDLPCPSGWYLRKHRLFELSFPVDPHNRGRSPICPPVVPLPCCRHEGQAIPVYGHSGGRSVRDGLRFPRKAVWQAAMQVEWMTNVEMGQAIPPCYTHWIGQEIIVRLPKAGAE
jgi:DNA (cytosine-5)-methyltransferase 1